MELFTLVVPKELMSLNPFINSQRANRYGGNKDKQNETDFVAMYVAIAMRHHGYEVKEKDLPLDFEFRWFAKNRRQDKDNIAFAKKFIFDGMIRAGLIENDGWKQIGNFKDVFEVDPKKPRVEIVVYSGRGKNDGK